MLDPNNPNHWLALAIQFEEKAMTVKTMTEWCQCSLMAEKYFSFALEAEQQE